MDKAEEYARREFAAHQRRDIDTLGRYRGPGYERWRDRSLVMQRQIDAATLGGRIADMERQKDGPDYER